MTLCSEGALCLLRKGERFSVTQKKQERRDESARFVSKMAEGFVNRERKNPKAYTRRTRLRGAAVKWINKVKRAIPFHSDIYLYKIIK